MWYFTSLCNNLFINCLINTQFFMKLCFCKDVCNINCFIFYLCILNLLSHETMNYFFMWLNTNEREILVYEPLKKILYFYIRMIKKLTWKCENIFFFFLNSTILKRKKKLMQYSILCLLSTQTQIMVISICMLSSCTHQ